MLKKKKEKGLELFLITPQRPCGVIAAESAERPMTFQLSQDYIINRFWRLHQGN